MLVVLVHRAVRVPFPWLPRPVPRLSYRFVFLVFAGLPTQAFPFSLGHTNILSLPQQRYRQRPFLPVSLSRPLSLPPVIQGCFRSFRPL